MPGHYGAEMLDSINTRLGECTLGAGVQLLTFQFNAEHELVDHIHAAPHDGINFIIFNPAVFTHTSVALRDTLLAVFPWRTANILLP